MATPYKALRVPIWFLHQKAYDTSRRLPKLDHKDYTNTPPRVTVVGPTITNGLDRHIFERFPHLRRSWYKAGGMSIRCRGCDFLAKTDADRLTHHDCFTSINEAINSLQETHLCAICEAPVNVSYVLLQSKYAGVPVCSEDCMCIWNELVPPSLEFELGLAKLRKTDMRYRHDL